MNVDPVHASSAKIERQTPEKKLHIAPPPPDGASGGAPTPEIAKTQSTPAPSVIPEHEVKLQLDTSAENTVMVYQVLDKQSGALVLQVPSAEEIRNLQRTQELLQRIASKGEPSRQTQPGLD
jgi:hypothetical protein